MKSLFFALLLLAAPLPSLAADCRLPTGLPKIIGSQYPIARGKLIVSGFMPIIPHDATYDTTAGAQWQYGYLEGEGCATGFGHANYRWNGFTVHAVDCWRITRISCP